MDLTRLRHRIGSSRLGPLLVALLVLVSSSASFHGYLLQPSCERVEGECRPHDEPCGDLAADRGEHQDCENCHEACCVAVGVALASSRGSLLAAPAHPSPPPPERAAPRRSPFELFRPPLA